MSWVEFHWEFRRHCSLNLGDDFSGERSAIYRMISKEPFRLKVDSAGEGQGVRSRLKCCLIPVNTNKVSKASSVSERHRWATADRKCRRQRTGNTRNNIIDPSNRIRCGRSRAASRVTHESLSISLLTLGWLSEVVQNADKHGKNIEAINRICERKIDFLSSCVTPLFRKMFLSK